MTGVDTNQWYEFCSREADETADLELLRQHTNDRLVRGSNAATLQEPCISCEGIMPGICFYKVRRNLVILWLCLQGSNAAKL